MWQTRKTQQAPLSGRGLNEESKTVSSAAVETEDVDSKEDQELTETGSDTELHEHGQVWSTHQGGNPHTEVGQHWRRLEDTLQKCRR